MSTKPRQYDLIILGATGYTGRLTAEYISKNHQQDLDWAVAGRNHTKLSAIVTRLESLNPSRKGPAIEVTDISSEQLDILVRKTKVLITTVGPFHRFGTAVIAACAAAGTHYLDSTGETPWVYDIAHKYHQQAQQTGAIMIPHCAMDSAPADLLAYALVRFIREKCASGTANLTHLLEEFENDASGSTIHSLITVASFYPLSHLKKSVEPYALCVEGHHPTVDPSVPRFGLSGSHRDPELGLMTDSVIGVPDTALVYRSWSLMNTPEDNYYGANFSYFTGMKAQNRVSGFFWHHMMALSMPMLSLSFVQWLATKALPEMGKEPSEESRKNNYTTWKAIAQSDESPSRRAICDMSYKGDMYTLTAILLAEAAMVLLRPDRENKAVSLGGGVLTPATLGDQFIERVIAAGVDMDIRLIE